MPEGDTVHTLAGLIGGYLTGRCIEAGYLTRPEQALPAVRVASVQALGKHLLVEFDTGHTLRTHLGLHGSWHRYAAGERWRRPRRQARVVLAVAGQVLVCFNAAEAELLAPRGDGVRRAINASRVGPDLALAHAPEAVLTRLRCLCPADAPIVDALLDQRIAAGIGNVFKSELLFLERLDPGTSLGGLDDERCGALYARAARLIADNVGRARRTTRAAAGRAGALWVYGRAGKPCFECATPVRRRVHGRHWRSTYWCPRCQAPGDAATPS